jgi:hypothetical protein
MPLIKGCAVPFFWAASDLAERLHLGKNPWRPAGVLSTEAPASPHLFH